MKTTDSDHDLPVAPKRLRQDFTATSPNQVWVSDITYTTSEGWLNLAKTMDLFSPRIVSWSMAETLLTQIAIDALTMAIDSRRPLAGLIHHSDRGCQHASEAFRSVLDGRGLVASMSRSGNCYDNAAMESFYGTLKTELVHRAHYATRASCRRHRARARCRGRAERDRRRGSGA